jgi:hypothetical protein
MKQEKRLIDQWKAGVGILVRLVFLSILANVIVIPIRVLNIWIESGTMIANVVAGVYLIIVVPLALPEITRICGLRRTKVDEIDGSGGMNEASKRKMAELRAERESRIPEANKPCVATGDNVPT